MTGRVPVIADRTSWERPPEPVVRIAPMGYQCQRGNSAAVGPPKPLLHGIIQQLPYFPRI